MTAFQDKINHGQLACLCFSFLSGFSTLYLLEVKVVKHDVWMSNLLATFVAIGVLRLLCYVQWQYPNSSMMEICEKLLGKWVAKLVLIIYLFYFLELGGLAYRALASFFTTAILPNTPSHVLIFFMVLAISYAVYLDLGAIARAIQFVLPLFVLAICVISISILQEVETNPFLPQFQSGLSEIVYGGILSFAFPFGKSVVLGFLLSRVINTKKIFISSIVGLSLSSIYLIAASYLTFGSLGMALTRSATFPFFSAVQLVKFGEYMERIEIVIIAIWTITTLFELVVIQYVFVKVMGHVFRFKESKPLVFPIGLLFFAMAQKSYTRMSDIVMYNYEILPFSSLVPTAFIPVLLAIMTMIRKRQV